MPALASVSVVEIRKFRDNTGSVPFDDWFHRLRDLRAKARIQIRLDRLSMGLEGDGKSVGDAVRKLRIPEGPGYRVYYAWDGQAVVILLGGGDKSTQERDIEQAKRRWRIYCGQ